MKTILRFVALVALMAASAAAQTIYQNVQRGSSMALANTRVPFSDASGRLVDDADLTFATDTLTATKGTFGGVTHVSNAIGAANSVTSVALSPLTLGTGTSGTALSFASATNIATFTAGIVSTTATHSALTSGRVTFAGTGGLLSGDSDLTFATDTLTFTNGLTSMLGIGTGTTAPITNLQVVDTGTATPRGITNDQYNTGTNGAQMNWRKARGTFATPLTIVTGDLLGRALFWGHDGTQFIESGNLRFTSEGTIGTGRVPSNFGIWVSTDAVTSVLTQTASFSGSNGIAFTALGTNQSITLAPSGTGGVTLSGAGSATLGLFRFPSAATSAGGIAFGADTFLYRSGNNTLALDTVAGASADLVLRRDAGTGFARLGTTGTGGDNLQIDAVRGALILRTNGSTTALTLDTSQNATFAGNILRFATTKGVQGSNTNDDVAAGYIGEYASTLKAIGSPVSLSNNTAADIISVTLTAGDWDVTSLASVTETTSTVTLRSAGITSTSATMPTDGSEGYNGVQSVVTSETNSIPLNRKRFSLSTTTTIYLDEKVTFSAGTAGGFGAINARRAR